MACVISASGLSKSYGDVRAVDDVSLGVEPGEIYALLGLNGAGKTTMIRMLLGMVRPTAGSVSLFGSAGGLDWRAPWWRVGYLVEMPASYPELTARENLDVTRRLRGMVDPRSVEEVVERLGLGPYADRRARTLSLGNSQRLGLAKALIHRPELLVLDEPVNGLDPAGVVEVRTMLRTLAEEQGVTVFLSSHLLSEVALLATRIGVIHRGRLLAEWDTDTLARSHGRLLVSTRDDPRARTVLVAAGRTVTTLGVDGLAVEDDQSVQRPEDVATLLVNAGCPPVKLVVEQDSLERSFLRLVGAETDRR